MLPLRGQDKSITSRILLSGHSGPGPNPLRFPEPNTPVRRALETEAAIQASGEHRRPAAPAIQSAASGPHGPGRAGAATLRAGVDRRSSEPVRCRPARPSLPSDGNRGGTYPAAPPPPAAATQPAVPRTIFCRRPGLGGGHQPPLRRRQPTQPSAPGRRAPGEA